MSNRKPVPTRVGAAFAVALMAAALAGCTSHAESSVAAPADDRSTTMHTPRPASPSPPDGLVTSIETGEDHGSCNIPQPLADDPASGSVAPRAVANTAGIPPIDAAVPQHLETAMFAVG